MAVKHSSNRKEGEKPPKMIAKSIQSAYNTLNYLTRNHKRVKLKYKDRIFCDLFGGAEGKQACLDLYNAINKTAYTNPDDLEIVTIGDAIYASMKDDVAYIVGCYLSVFEQQSTINPNMPLRGFLYFAEEYEQIYWRNNRKIYSGELVKIKAPQYVVFYNGSKNAPEYQEMHLSDAFETPVEGYEWTAHVYNINDGKNKDILEACKLLGEYAAFVDQIRKYRKEGMSVQMAVTTAVDRFIQKGGSFADYLAKHRKRAISSILSEYDEKGTWEEISAVSEAKGRAEGAWDLAIRYYRSGHSSAEVAAEMLGVSVQEFLDRANQNE